MSLPSKCDVHDIQIQITTETLQRLEGKVDKLADCVEDQSKKWAVLEATLKLKKSTTDKILVVLGIIATSGIIEFFLNHIFR